MNALLPIVLFCFLLFAISLFGYKKFARSGRLLEQLKESGYGRRTRLETDWIGLIRKLGERVPVSPQSAGLARKNLISAGFRSEMALPVFFGLKALSAAVLFLVMSMMRDVVTANTVMRNVLLVASPAAGFTLPGIVLERLVERRRRRLRLSLPDALDLMVVCVEAGLGLDQAVLNVSRELGPTHPEICEELSLMNFEMRAGHRRVDALRNLAGRTGEPELRKLVAILIQADRFGTSIAESLRTHSDFMRVRRRQDAEEKAAKVGVKLVFPVFFFIMPAMMVVAVGPGMLQLFKQLMPMMKNFKT